MQTVCSELVEIRRLEPQDRWDTRAIHSVIGVPWRMTDGRWTVDRPEVQVDPIPIHPPPFNGVRIQRERITKQDIDEFGATIGCPGCNAIKDNKRAQAHSDRCRKRIEESLRNTPHGAERLDRRDEVINEALAEEVRRGDQRKKKSDGTTTAVPGTRSTAPEPMAASATPGLRENPIEPDTNPKRRLLMKSASLTASGSSLQREKRPIPNGESRVQDEDMSETGTGEGTALPATPSVNTRRRIVGKSEPMAVTTQEAVEGYREKARRIASVEQIELGNIMELSITGQVLKWARQINLSGGLSLRKSDGWNLKNHSHLTVARHLREKTHPSMLVVTIREGEDQGLCNAALRELWRNVQDQIEERSIVVIVMSRNSAIWRRANLKSVMRENQLKYVDVEGMRVITNSKYVAEQIKIDKEENVVMDEPKIGEFGRIERQQNLKSIAMDGPKFRKFRGDDGKQRTKDTVMDGVKFGKVGKLENCRIDDEMQCRSEEKFCKSILKGLARRIHEKHTMLADVEEDQEQDIICFDDITGKELPWRAVRKAREMELKYLRDLEVYEKVDEKEAFEKYGVTPIDTKWVDTDKAFEEEPMQIRSRICAREYAGTPPLEALKAIISIAANHKETFSIMHIDVSRAYFHAKAHRPVLIRLPVED